MRGRAQALLVAGAVALAVATPAGPALAQPAAVPEVAVPEVAVLRSVGVQLPVSFLSAIELDEDRGRLYIAQGVGAGGPIAVTDLDGRPLTSIGAVTDVSDLVLSDDGTTLLAAQGYAQVTAIDTNTLTVQAVYSAPDGACVETVEPTGNKIVAGFLDCGIGSGGLLVWSGPGSAPVVYTGGPNYHPVIDGSPGAAGLLVAGDTGYSPVTTYVIDVAGETPRIVATRDYTGSNLRDYAISGDGTEVVETVGSPYEHRAYRLPDLADALVYPSGVYPADATWSADSSTVVVGRAQTNSEPDVYFYDKGSTIAKYAVDFHPDDVLWDGTLLVNRDGSRAWAVSYDDTYQQVQLLHSFGPAHPPNPPVTDLTVTARTGTGKYRSTAYLTIGWTSPTGEDDFAWITASTNGGPEREFWRWPMAPGGPITLDYALPNGTTTFTVRYRDYWNFYPDGFATVTITR